MEEERRTLRLSDAFETDTGAGEYEWTATMININSGKNQSVMDSCHVLYEYAVFVAKIKKYRDSMELKEAIDLAVRECIGENILRNFLEQHRREVCDMCLTEFDEKKYEDVLREEGREGGRSFRREKNPARDCSETERGEKSGTVSCRWNGKRICGFCYHAEKASVISNKLNLIKGRTCKRPQNRGICVRTGGGLWSCAWSPETESFRGRI